MARGGQRTPRVSTERRRTATVSALYALITYATMFPTWPSRLRTRIPDGVGDNLLNLWILHWAGHHALGAWSGLWNAPIFWPNRNTLAYSDSMLPIAIVHRALAIVLRSDVLAFNLVYLAAAFASMLGGYMLARRITGSVEGAFFAGLVYALATPRIVQYRHFQLGFLCLVPFVVLLTIRYFDAPRIRRGVALGLVIALLSMSSGYYALMTLIALLIVVPGLIVTWRRFPLRRVAGGLAVGAACAVVLFAPVALKYNSLERHAGFRRVPDPYLAAHPSDFVRVSLDNRLLGEVLPFSPSATVENFLFPGFVASVLGAAGLVVLIRRSRELLEVRTVETLTLALCTAASMVLLVLSFGASATVAGHVYALPYHLVEGLPGFSGIRTTARFVAFPLLTLAVLAALGIARITAALRSRERVLLVLACAAFLLIETSIPIQINRVPSAPDQTAVNFALARRAPGPVVEMPLTSNSSRADVWAEVETLRMWLATIDGHPRVNGYSGAQPPGFPRFVDDTNRAFPNDRTLRRLADLGVRYVVLRIASGREDPAVAAAGFYTEREARRIISLLPAGGARLVGRFGKAYLITVPAPNGTSGQ